MHEISEQDPRRFLPLHPLEIRILLAVTEGPVHGYRIVSSIEESGPTWNRIFPANLYRRIRTLIRDGLMEEVEPVAGDPVSRRKYFRITKLGRVVLAEESSRMRALLEEAQRKGFGRSLPDNG